MAILPGEPGLDGLPSTLPHHNPIKHHPSMPFSDSRKDSSKGRGVEGKYIP